MANRRGLSAEEWDYYQARKQEAEYNPSDPKQNLVKHIFVHNDNEQNTVFLQARIDKAIAKIVDMSMNSTDKNELIKILTGSIKK